MKRDIATLEQLSDLFSFDQIIDVRSPGEFAEDHIPYSINCPVLDNQQRIEIGTLYKQASPFEAKKLGAAYVSTNIARHLQAQFLDRPKNWRPLIVCWRGGQRSGAMTHVFRRIGWDAQQLEGGYKAYRRLVVEELAERPRKLQFKVLCGATGSAKSRILQAIGRRGEQVLDLEELACHKGSVLGVLPDSAQPSQKMFESQLLTALRALDADRPVYVEAESRKIGSLQVPAALIEAMRGGECFTIEASFSARVDFLLRDYDYFLLAPERLNACLHPLRKLHSVETLQRWQDYVRHAQWRELVSELLELHYDPLYNRSQTRNYGGFATPALFTSDDLSPAGVEALALRVCGG
ncbi:MAG: tRNA 2-selenouridine synthase [Candidatus Accumulibacter appositus]|uniref:tRNA 2-selenouridine synthase n=1 Tax=Candidatus Accumulibacter appositus TaxID=1454003 RepID=A0A011PM17_9PROT|nr:tRNA 2-selenouridine(34) synthase MnmH [Accumulibacter sp.]EXI78047.1 MAG: tRNA 2-selenouridine synthase [Candidatus Accumulibacter appositus]HRF05998.1 tRNA 2-selenouridine(34) synthase MnmH [Accumulibacter sp.]